MKINKYLFFIFLIGYSGWSQESTATVKGKINSQTKPAKNVNIVNLNSHFGTVSNSNGEFEIFVQENDTLLFSSLEYESLKIFISSKIIQKKLLAVTLNPQINALNEIFLRGLSGNLALDLNLVPTDNSIKNNFSFKPNDLTKKLGKDIHGYKSAPFVGPFKPLPATAVLEDKAYLALLKLKRELAQKKEFPEKLKSEFGIDFFTKTLKIPLSKINHFISFCEYRNILKKYYTNHKLEVIAILQDESEKYLKLEN